jgi:hypothetical protein
VGASTLTTKLLCNEAERIRGLGLHDREEQLVYKRQEAVPIEIILCMRDRGLKSEPIIRGQALRPNLTSAVTLSFRFAERAIMIYCVRWPIVLPLNEETGTRSGPLQRDRAMFHLAWLERMVSTSEGLQ